MKKYIILGLLVLLIIGLGLIPYDTTVVPRWNLRVLDEHDAPYEGLRVVEYWKHYSLELDGGENGEERWTDRNGLVEFPRQTIRMSLAGRGFRMILTSINRLMHGSTGIRAHAMVNGPQGVTWVNYKPGEAPPDIMRLRRDGTPDK